MAKFILMNIAECLLHITLKSFFSLDFMIELTICCCHFRKVISLALVGSTATAGSTLRIGTGAAIRAGGLMLATLGGLSSAAAAAAGASGGASTGPWYVLGGRGAATVTSSVLDTKVGTASLAILLPPAPLPLPTSQTFLIRLLDPAAASATGPDGGGGNCSTGCCADGSCSASARCCGPGHWYACLRLDYWDDSSPHIVSSSSLSGYV